MDPEPKPGSPRRGTLLMDTMASQLLSSKRSREAESDTMLDNFHSHKRYLTEVMATSLNGLRVGEGSGKPTNTSPLLADLIGSPTQADTASGSARDDMSNLDSAMSDDSDDSVSVWRVPDHVSHPNFPQQSPVSSSESARLSPCWRPSDKPSWISGPNEGAEMCACSPPSPGSPRRRPNASGAPPGALTTPGAHAPYSHSHPFAIPARPQPYHHSKHLSDAEGRLPPSPSDPSQSANLRRAALLRAFQARSQVPANGGVGSPPPPSPPHSHPHPTNLNPSLFSIIKPMPRSFFSVTSPPPSAPIVPSRDFPLLSSSAANIQCVHTAEGTASSFGSAPSVGEDEMPDRGEEGRGGLEGLHVAGFLANPGAREGGGGNVGGTPFLGGIALGLVQKRNLAMHQSQQLAAEAPVARTKDESGGREGEGAVRLGKRSSDGETLGEALYTFEGGGGTWQGGKARRLSSAMREEEESGEGVLRNRVRSSLVGCGSNESLSGEVEEKVGRKEGERIQVEGRPFANPCFDDDENEEEEGHVNLDAGAAGEISPSFRRPTIRIEDADGRAMPARNEDAMDALSPGP